MNQNHSRDMAGRTVLVTGATSGIGKATAVGLAALDAYLAITGYGTAQVGKMRTSGARTAANMAQDPRCSGAPPAGSQLLIHGRAVSSGATFLLWRSQVLA
jgi:NAD(P)-dependent dehydrogenase (short-subunit alcohol dehydrogenase family)